MTATPQYPLRHRPGLRQATLPATRLLPALLLPLCMTGAGCSRPQGAEQKPLTGEIQRRQAVRVRTVALEQREMVRTTTTTTNVESEAEIEIFPRAAGIVTELLVEEGDIVAAGDVLAVLDQREARVALREAELSLAESRDGVAAMKLAREEAAERLERAKLTWEQTVRDVERNEQAGLISQADLDALRLTRDQAYRDLQAARVAVDAASQNEKSSQTSVEKAQVAIERQQLALSFTEITAPFDGIVAQRSVKVGDSVSSAASAFVLTDPENLRAVFARPQRDLPMFRRATLPADDAADDAAAGGIEIQAHTEAIPGRVFTGEIQLVSPTIDPASGSFRVTVRLKPSEEEEDAGPTERLLPGMLVRLDIVTERHRDALVVPKRALQREGDTNFIYTVDDGRAHRIEVREGFSDDEYVEVFAVDEPLVPGQPVIAVGNRDLEEGDAVDSEEWTGTAAAPGDAGRESAAQVATEGAEAAPDEAQADTSDEGEAGTEADTESGDGEDDAASTDGAE